ncbi:MAG: TIGR01459 family HAD-type hydrolase [Cereibacter sphaeroides]|uniref:TIGR01459 family HAD-type hydrolase n=1 Tax=Cereibacter sphaeroides TaxID=1063 RepID=A0A2W5UBE0_CERSP|nr:MAG: TIGR01459 family HAD-type hydrolase [Cereibacter sphaeroides]
MTRIISSLAEISANYDVLFCDLWGCLHNGQTPYPAAVEALRAFRAKGGTVLLLTNSPRPKPSVIKQLDRIGVPHDCYDELVSSGDAAQYALITGAAGRRVHHLGPEKDRVFFTELSKDIQEVAKSEPPIELIGLQEAEGIVCTGLFDDRTETPDDYRATLLFAKTKNLPLLCANPDIIVDYGHTRLFCAGAIAQAYDQMGGHSLYFGKPHPPIYDLARRRLAAMPSVPADPQILAVGDGIATDVLGASGEGIDVVFVTGGIAGKDFGADIENPDRHLLLTWLEEKQLSATYSIGQLR